MTFRLVGGDAIEAMQAMAENSVDAIVTDPPYGLEFMGKEWDKPWARDFTSIGDGAPLPDRQLHVNPRCRSCGGYRRGTKNPCRCEAPVWADSQAAAVGRTNAVLQEWHHAWATEALRILKPGGHLLACGGTRTYHRLACAIEDAGFEIRDCIAWMYGSGFPKSLDVSKAIDKAAGAEREVVGVKPGHEGFEGRDNMKALREGTLSGRGGGNGYERPWMHDPAKVEAAHMATAPATPEAQRWNGWGTALKPAFEPIVLARKPLSERNVAANVQRWGTGALNVDWCRIGDTVETWPDSRSYPFGEDRTYGSTDAPTEETQAAPAGRWPANVTLGHSPDCEQTGETRKVRTGTAVRRNGVSDGNLFGAGLGAHPEGTPDLGYADEDGTESVPVWKCAPGCAVAMLDEQTGERRSGANPVRRGADLERLAFGEFNGQADANPQRGAEVGAASRFFYCPKADREERNRGLGHMPMVPVANAVGDPDNPTRTRGSLSGPRANSHPTVKPVELMRWLCRMVTPKGGTVLDPFTGSGSTGVAAMREGFEFIGIEREAEYVEIARARIIGDAPLFNVEAGVPNE